MRIFHIILIILKTVNYLILCYNTFISYQHKQINQHYIIYYVYDKLILQSHFI